MSSPMLELDEKLSSLVEGKVIKEIRHIDNDLCVKILFSDGEYLIIDTMKINVEHVRPYMPILSHYNVDGFPSVVY